MEAANCKKWLAWEWSGKVVVGEIGSRWKNDLKQLIRRSVKGSRRLTLIENLIRRWRRKTSAGCASGYEESLQLPYFEGHGNRWVVEEVVRRARGIDNDKQAVDRRWAIMMVASIDLHSILHWFMSWKLVLKVIFQQEKCPKRAFRDQTIFRKGNTLRPCTWRRHGPYRLKGLRLSSE